MTRTSNLKIWMGILALTTVIQTQKCEGFEEYVVKYNKKYKDIEEYEYREKVYCENVKKIEEINAQNLSYKLGINKFTDITDEEMSKRNGYQENAFISTKQQSSQKPTKVGQYPSSLDWRSSGIITSIKDQGSCGSCWAFATAAMCESKLVKDGQFSIDIDLSQQYLLQCTQYSTCSGGYIQYVAKEATQQGIPREQTYPYQPFQTHSGICQYNGVHCANSNQDYYKLSDQDIIILLQDRPVEVGIASSGWSGYSSGIFQCSSSAKVDHAVLLVGYQPDHWIVKNQWGENWGENGYIRITRTSGRNCLIGHSVHTLWGNIAQLSVLVLLVAMLFI